MIVLIIEKKKIIKDLIIKDKYNVYRIRFVKILDKNCKQTLKWALALAQSIHYIYIKLKNNWSCK